MEYIDILDENGNWTGKKDTREIIHSNGLWHKTIHVWITNSNHELLLQKRAPFKKVHPNQWTTSVSGHLEAGDSSTMGALREVQEEIGLSLTEEQLIYLFTVKEQTVPVPNYINNEIVDVYLVKLNLDPSTLILQEKEVSEAKFISLEDFKHLVEVDSPTLVRHPKIHLPLISYLEEHM